MDIPLTSGWHVTLLGGAWLLAAVAALLAVVLLIKLLIAHP